MFRPNAQRVHAQVVEGRTLWNRPDVELIREPMGIPLSPRAVIELDGHDAISALSNHAAPFPTLRPDLDPSVEPGSGVSRPRVLIASLHGSNYTTHYTEHIGRQLIARTGRAAA